MKAKKGEVIHKLKIARGQIDGILQMIEEDRYCVDISNQLQATQALLKSANQQILQAHIRNCVREALQTDVENPKLEEALKVLEKMAQYILDELFLNLPVHDIFYHIQSHSS